MKLQDSNYFSRFLLEEISNHSKILTLKSFLKIMKKLLLTSALLFAISCSYQNQKVTLDLSFDDKKSDIGNNVGLDLQVFDDRLHTDIVGIKELGDKKFTIAPEQNLTEFLRRKIKEDLFHKGFRPGKDKALEIHIETMKYKAERGFMLGKSTAEIAIKVVVINNRTGEKLTRNFTTKLNNKHFIAPLDSTDARIINSLLQETMSDIINDEPLLRNLAK